MSFGGQIRPGRMVHAFNQGQVDLHVFEASLVSSRAVREGYKERPSDDKEENSSFLLLSSTQLRNFYSLFTGHSSMPSKYMEICGYFFPEGRSYKKLYIVGQHGREF